MMILPRLWPGWLLLLPLLTLSVTADSAASCFCSLYEGALEDCPCTADTVDTFNSELNPALLSLLNADYFRYFQVDFTAPCPRGWDAQCESENCAVSTCDPAQLPGEVREGVLDKVPPPPPSLHARLASWALQLFPVLRPVLAALQDWWAGPGCGGDPYPEHHAVQAGQFCKLDPATSPASCQFVDLVENPEQFTGYSGAAATRVWNTVYDELCFHPETEDKTLYLNSGTARGLCREKRAFYKLVSGLHSSVAVHLCSRYLLRQAPEPVWGVNYEEFRRRFSPATTAGEGPERLKNIYFLFLVELRAAEKVSPLLKQLQLGDTEQVERLWREVVELCSKLPQQFDETELFREEELDSPQLMQLYKERFREISELMDCLGCERCKVWAKLQVTGIGTALKILFTPQEELHLTKHEIVALFNALGRHSTSISELKKFQLADL